MIEEPRPSTTPARSPFSSVARPPATSRGGQRGTDSNASGTLFDPTRPGDDADIEGGAATPATLSAANGGGDGDGDGAGPRHLAASPPSPRTATGQQPGDAFHDGPEQQTHHRRRRSCPRWARIHPFRGMYRDVKARLPYYWSDWADAWNYRVIPSTVQMFFANILPAIAFSFDLFTQTNQSYGVNEVLLSTFMAAFVFSIFGGQPLLVVGVTGPITVLSQTTYRVLPKNVDYLAFMGWVYVHGAWMHFLIAALNGVNFLRYVTRFSCDTFGLYVALVYLQYGCQTVDRSFSQYPQDEALLTLVCGLLTVTVCFLFNRLSISTFLHRVVRRVFADYGMPITVVAISAVPHWGKLLRSHISTLPTGAAFTPTNGREWLVRFWELPAKWVGVAVPFGILLTILFYFDSNVSSLIAQGSEFPLRKPPGFHWDFFLLGITTFLAALLGLPAPNGLIPQAPIHTESLLVYERVKKYDRSKKREDLGERGEKAVISPEQANVDEKVAARASDEPPSVGGGGDDCKAMLNRRNTAALNKASASSSPSQHAVGNGFGAKIVDEGRRPTSKAEGEDESETIVEDYDVEERPVAVVEQRFSNLAQGSLCLVLMTEPFLHVLGLIPRGVLAGLFWYMGASALETNGVVEKIYFLLRDRHFTPRDPNVEPLRKVRKTALVAFVACELVGFGVTFAVTQTIAAVGFPIPILLLVPLRAFLMPKMPFFTTQELKILDAPPPNLPFALWEARSDLSRYKKIS